MTQALSRLNIRSRMMIILITFLIPLGILAYKVNAKLQEAISFSSHEIQGTQIIAPLTKLLNLFADHQMSLIQKQAGNTSVDADIKSTVEEINKYIAQLVALNDSVGSDLDFTPEGLKKHGQAETLTIANLKQKWEAANAAPFAPEAYKSLMADVTTMIKHAGDTSGLILDGDLDTYYIVDASLNVFPALVNLLTNLQIEGYKALLAGGNKLDTTEQNSLGNIADSLENNFVPHVHDSITTALHEDANFHGISPSFQSVVSKKLTDYEALNQKVVAAIRTIEKGGEMDANAYVDTIDAMHNATSEFAQASLEELGKMIEVRLAALKHERMLIMAEVAALIALAFGLFFIVANSITRPIRAMTDVMGVLSKGDMSVEIPSTQNKDEVGEMARTVLVFKDNMIQTEALRQEQEAQKLRAAEEKRSAMNTMANNFEASVKTVVTEVSASATQMRGNAERLSQLAGETKSNSAIVSSSATEAAQTATQVAAAAEELTAAIGEISAQVQKSSGVANQASAQAESINQSMHLLVDKSNRVGEVIQFITNIASQINLLALNATIESARAGEAGRGFAVVASEVKNLANQTAKATEEIVQQVQSMQEATHEAVQSVGQIITIIGEISQSTAGVAAAVEEQSAATNEISRNITHTAAGTNEISRSIVAVEQGADETGTSSRQVLDSAKALSEQSKTLSQKVDEFLLTVRNM